MTTIKVTKGDTSMKMMRQNPMNKLLRVWRSRTAVTAALAILFGTVPIAHAIDLMHNSADTASKKWQAQGGWGVAGGKYGQFTCATCHEPYSGSLKSVRRVISTMNGENWPNGSPEVAVSFNNLTSMGADKGGHATSNRICEVCHSQNQFHNFNTANNSGGLNHPTPAAVCTSCHKHNTGFKAACGGCHGNPPTAAVLGGDYGLIGTPRASNAMAAGQVGAHATHTQARAMVCDTCHYINNGTIKMPNLSNTIDIGFYGFGGKVTSGTYVPYSSVTPHANFKFNSGTPNTTIASVVNTYAAANKCVGVYCHGGGVKVGATQTKAPLTGGSNTTPRWDGTSQSACGSCHGTTAATPPTMGSHVIHAASTGGNSYSCDLCHPVSGDNTHVQGNVRWAMKTTDPRVGTGAIYNGAASGSTGDLAPSATYGQCSNVACHSDGKSGPPRLTATWGDTAFDADCAGCHGGNAASSAPIATDMHGQHVNQATVNGELFGCAECHAPTVSADRAIVNRANHNNRFVNFSGAKAGRNKAACNAAYCHSDGKGGAGTAVSWTTGPAIANCIGCHGAATPADFVSVAGEPNYASTGGNQTRSNSHKRHVAGGAASCIYCHNDTVTPAGGLTGSNHLDRTIQVAKGGGKEFTYGAGKSCSAISCHGTGSPDAVWGATMPAECTGCHGGNAAAAPNDIKSGKHTQHINQQAINGENYGCVECHAQTVSADRTVANQAGHVNQFPNYSGARAGKNVTACNTAYCHSDGKGGAGTAVSWSTGPAIDNCIGCHGAAVPADFTSVAGEPNYVSTGASQPRANSHKKHVGSSGAVTCAYCHGETVVESGALNTSTKHIDRTIQVAQGGLKSFTYTAADKSCASISCHGAGSPVAYWGATMPADCTGCHGGNAGSLSAITTGMHGQHVNQASLNGENYGCAECHAQTVSGDRTVANQGVHGNQFVNYSGAKAGRNAAACNASYCHSDGKGGAGLAVSWTTGPAISNCIGCHGSDSAPDFTSAAGEPNYANAGAGLLKSNSHKSHTTKLTDKGAASCGICHVNTVSAGGTAIAASGLHLNRQVEVTFDSARAGSGARYNADRTCSTTSCHGSGTPKWGDAASAGCSACHPNLGGTHLLHIGDLASASLVSFYNFTANRSSGTVYRFGCATCHPTDLAKHRNGSVDITLNMNKAGAGSLVKLNNQVTTDDTGYNRGGANSFTCLTVYCHSNGKSQSLQAGDYRETPNWYNGTFPGGNRCGGCHDNPPQYAGQSHYVASSSMGDDGGTPPFRETGHMIGIHALSTYAGNNRNGYLGYSSSGSKAHGNPALATTIACYICHSGIVSTTQIDTYAMTGTGSAFRCASCHTAGSRTPLQTGAIANAALHVNGSKDVAFAPVTFKTKAQLANVANALGWSRSGNYKADDAYDSFNMGSSTWDPQTRTCLTACHVNQPNITWGAQLQCFSCHANQ